VFPLFSLLTMLILILCYRSSTTFIFTLNPVINCGKLDEASYLILLKTNMSIVPTISIIPTFPLTNGKMTKHIRYSLLDWKRCEDIIIIRKKRRRRSKHPSQWVPHGSWHCWRIPHALSGFRVMVHWIHPILSFWQPPFVFPLCRGDTFTILGNFSLLTSNPHPYAVVTPITFMYHSDTNGR